MATKLKATKPPMVEEVHFRSDNAFLALVVNRRTRIIRVIDFRSGALPAKRLFIQSVAKREGIEKIVTLVEKDEVSSWTRVGFVREGTVPGFYKRSDGHLCGCLITEKTASVEVTDAGQKLAEKTVIAGKRVAKDVSSTTRGVTVNAVDEADALEQRDQLWRKPTDAINSFDVFGRDAERVYYDCSFKKSRPNYISGEFQDCFGHSLVEILRLPASEPEITATVEGLKVMCEDLKARGIVSAFGFAPSDDVTLAGVYLSAGFRKTGLLAGGILVGEQRKDAILWSQKLANPGDVEE